jgi:hypothetical protein
MQMGHYDLLHTVRESAAALRTSLLESLASQRAQRAEGWERDRREWLESVREIGNNWRSELAGEIHRTRTEIGEAVDASSARRRAASDMYLALPCERAGFPAAGTKVIVDTLKKRAEKLGPLKAAALKQVLHLNVFLTCLQQDDCWSSRTRAEAGRRRVLYLSGAHERRRRGYLPPCVSSYFPLGVPQTLAREKGR